MPYNTTYKMSSRIQIEEICTTNTNTNNGISSIINSRRSDPPSVVPESEENNMIFNNTDLNLISGISNMTNTIYQKMQGNKKRVFPNDNIVISNTRSTE